MPCLLVWSEETDVSEATLHTRLLHQVQEKLADDEALVCDRGFLLTQIQAAGMLRYVPHSPINVTTRRAALPA